MLVVLRIGPCVRETSTRWERKLIPLTVGRGESLGVKEETSLNREDCGENGSEGTTQLALVEDRTTKNERAVSGSGSKTSNTS